MAPQPAPQPTTDAAAEAPDGYAFSLSTPYLQAAMAQSLNAVLVQRNVRIDGKRSSMRLEPGMWAMLETIAEREGLSVNQLIAGIDARKTRSATLTACIRVFIASYYRSQADRLQNAFC